MKTWIFLSGVLGLSCLFCKMTPLAFEQKDPDFTFHSLDEVRYKTVELKPIKQIDIGKVGVRFTKQKETVFIVDDMALKVAPTKKGPQVTFSLKV